MTLDPSSRSLSGSPQIFNRTGSATAPEEAAEMLVGATVLPPSSEGDDQAIATVITEYNTEAAPIGTMPPPAPVASRKASPSELLMDKLGERMAFERAGTRLYDAMLAKLDGRVGEEPGPTREELLLIRNEEAEHYLIVAAALKQLGGDPTAMTPCANVQAVASMGLPQVVCDPRTTVAQALEALLIAELADNDAWATLISLTREVGLDEAMVTRFENARASEHDHLLKVRRWVKEAADARLAAGAPPDAQRTGTDD